MCHQFTTWTSSARLSPFQWSVFACSPKESIIALPHNIFLNSSSISNIMSRLWLEILILSMAWDTLISGCLFRKIDANINPAKWNLLQKAQSTSKDFFRGLIKENFTNLQPLGDRSSSVWMLKSWKVRGGKMPKESDCKIHYSTPCIILHLKA